MPTASHRPDRGRVERARAVAAAALSVALVAAVSSVLATAAPSAAAADSLIAVRGPASSVGYGPDSTSTISLAVPAGVTVGDVMVASIGFGKKGVKRVPTLTAPPGWSRALQTDRDSAGSLAVYWHVYSAGESTYSWTSSTSVGGAAFLTAFGGVDRGSPVSAAAGQKVGSGTTVSTPSITTTSPDSMLVASFYGYTASSGATSWTPPTAMTEVGDRGALYRSGSVAAALQPLAGSTGSKAATASLKQDYSIAAVIALRPATTTSSTTTTSTPPPPGAVPLIIDTDLFSSTDDVGAFAAAFGLQLRGEARVVAETFDTRTSRPTVATNSWRCGAAINQFYGSAAVPNGSDMPADGTEVNTVDFVGPCARLASPSTPAPGPALGVLRTALAAQADFSAVIVGIGYLENLAELLTSPADAISPLDGRALVARKVRSLVVMGGGYPSRTSENNLAGDPAAAQYVAANWPTKLVWSGYEVGDRVHNGQTLSAVHPQNSPVRVAYEAFVGPGNWMYSYDITALYHAVRPADTLLREVGPGTNAVDGNGGNVFTPGPGSQYYLTLSDPDGLDAAMETLIDTLPGGADTTPPVISGLASGSVTSTSAAVSWTTSEAADTQAEYGLTTGYGSLTPLDPTRVISHAATLTGLPASTVVHWRARSRDAAGNLAFSGDNVVTTAPTPVFAGPDETFDSNVLDPAVWTVISTGSTVAATNRQLEITHPGGGWTTGTLSTVTPHDQRNRALSMQMSRAANGAVNSGTFGETSIALRVDSTHFVYFFAAGGSLTAWVRNGSTETNLTPAWPSYSATAMQWLRFREAAGVIYWEYAGATNPTSWSVLASVADPFSLSAVTFQIIAGANTTTADTATFDSITTR